MKPQTVNALFLGIIFTLLPLPAVTAQEDGDQAGSVETGKKEAPRAQGTPAREVEKTQVKQEKIQGVEISVVNSTVQDGIQPVSRVNLEKVLKLLNQPEPKPQPSPSAAAGLGARKSKPKPAGGSGDARRTVTSPQEPLSGGS